MLGWARRLVAGRPRERPRRILWLLNHKTLLPAEVPILERLGFEVFAPTRTPGGADYTSATGRHAVPASLAAPVRALLEGHDFYTEAWSPELSAAIGAAFDLVVTSVIALPMMQALTHFQGKIILRVFGREGTHSYDALFADCGATGLVRAAAERLLFGQSYDNIAENEPEYLRAMAQTIGVGMPPSSWALRGSWRRSRDEILFICPNVAGNFYYRPQYERITAEFGGLRRLILGAQSDAVDDPAVLGYVTDAALFDLYGSAAAFAYISPEPRHLHYSPLEAIVVGMPTLYLRGGMLSILAGEALAGECGTLDEMRVKAERLVGGDDGLCRAITSGQDVLLERFTDAVVTQEWRAALDRLGLGHT